MAKRKPTKPTNKTSKKQEFIQSPAGYAVTGLVLWVLSYIFASMAIDTGSLLLWLATVVAFGWGIHRFVDAIKKR